MPFLFGRRRQKDLAPNDGTTPGEVPAGGEAAPSTADVAGTHPPAAQASPDPADRAVVGQARAPRDECAPLRRAFAHALEAVAAARRAADTASGDAKPAADAALARARDDLHGATAALDACEKKRGSA